MHRSEESKSLAEEETFSPDSSPHKQPLVPLVSLSVCTSKASVLNQWQQHHGPQKRLMYSCFCTRFTNASQLPWMKDHLEPPNLASHPCCRSDPDSHWRDPCPKGPYASYCSRITPCRQGCGQGKGSAPAAVAHRCPSFLWRQWGPCTTSRSQAATLDISQKFRHILILLFSIP